MHDEKSIVFSATIHALPKAMSVAIYKITSAYLKEYCFILIGQNTNDLDKEYLKNNFIKNQELAIVGFSEFLAKQFYKHGKNYSKKIVKKFAPGFHGITNNCLSVCAKLTSNKIDGVRRKTTTDVLTIAKKGFSENSDEFKWIVEALIKNGATNPCLVDALKEKLPFATLQNIQSFTIKYINDRLSMLTFYATIFMLSVLVTDENSDLKNSFQCFKHVHSLKDLVIKNCKNFIIKTNNSLNNHLHHALDSTIKDFSKVLTEEYKQTKLMMNEAHQNNNECGKNLEIVLSQHGGRAQMTHNLISTKLFKTEDLAPDNNKRSFFHLSFYCGTKNNHSRSQENVSSPKEALHIWG